MTSTAVMRTSAAQPLRRVLDFAIPDAEQTLGPRECMLYALSIGFGADPTDPAQLRYASELGSAVAPSIVLTAAAPGFWFNTPELGLDWARLLNVEQSVILWKPLPVPPVRLRSRSRIVSVADKGPGRGALLAWQRDLLLAGEREERLATVSSVVLLRGDGHERRVLKAQSHDRVVADRLPERAPDRTFDLVTSPNSGLLYRLNGPLNPLHADPEVARRNGFPRPLLPGTATLGWTCRALLEHACDFDPTKLRAFGAKLTAPAFPGDTLRFELWFDDDGAAFRVNVPERSSVVLDLGRAEFRVAA